jgi:hypothetical protein
MQRCVNGDFTEAFSQGFKLVVLDVLPLSLGAWSSRTSSMPARAAATSSGEGAGVVSMQTVMVFPL